ncbi:Glucomannan 4-beta-mannosyltransferase 9 [Cocos nucifera]|uniref:glucomannan 4-beta-mannosyltransferase n=1 Tax=Cocos nucifera TaxID=13894 RepID=A0A8K0I8U6_COCNU|nr:Glucomannan 4-beta-mannosyltransferase 9 [Cocos nucifera]
MEANNFHPLMLSIARACEIIFSSPVADILNKIGLIWREVRVMVIIPAMKAAVVVSLIMSVMVLAEKLSMALISLYAKLFRRRPERIYKCDPIAEDEELGTLAYPMVLVQIPMYNEKEDSVKKECEKWFTMGKNIKYETRDNRKGYKAGALKEGMKHSYVETCEYIAMFDADFQPASDFLMRTVPFLVHNPSIALVQARWKFVNANECLMARMQEMSMDYHFKVEQESGSTSCAFFGYNGTAGVWRIQAINEVGGWKDRTTVEDMDLAVRAGLGGWKMIFVGSIKVKSELPSTFKAYRFQQHRWSCGPANLFRKMLCDIMKAKKVSIWKKFYMIYSFFLVRRVLSHFATFFLYCVLMPLSVFFPEVEIPKWGTVYIPSTITVLNAVGTPSSFHLIIFWVLFENVMSLHRCKAVIIGLLEAGRANEWVVTEKLGDLLKTKPNIKVAKKYRFKLWERLHFLELGLAVYLMICACYDYHVGKDYYFVMIFPQAIAFVIMGVGCIGTIIPSDN